jgi:outer membrane protein assembly factor BamB
MPIASPPRAHLRHVTRTFRSRTLMIAVAIIVLAAVPALAEHTRWWRQSTFEDFDKGTAKGVALRSDGKLFLAPRYAEFADANLAYLLALRVDSKGNIYAAGGSNAKVLRFDASGKSTTVFESSELAAQTLVFDSSGNLYVGTSPDGKVYKVTPSGQSSVFFDPKTKYIWDLAVDKDGTVYVATGDTGKIFAVAPNGNGQLFYSGEETHIRALAIDAAGNVIAGTEPSGLVLRISKAADSPAKGATQKSAAAGTHRAFVLYQTAKKEITALTQDASGNLYVAAVGEKTAPSPVPTRPQTIESSVAASFTATFGAPGQQPGQQPQIVPFSPVLTVSSSSVYRIAADGSPEELWNSHDDVVYSLGLLSNGKLLLGTDSQGAVLELEGNHVFSRLVRTAAGQVTSITSGPGGKLFLGAANPGKVFTLGPDSEPEGSYESQPFDAHIFSRWGRMEWWGQSAASSKTGGGARIEFYARSGNTSDPENNWSPWAGPYNDVAGSKIDSPSARFVQWKAVLHGSGSGMAPELDWVNIAYLPKNIAPEITGIAIQNPGTRVQGMSMPMMGSPSQASIQIRMPLSPPSSSSASIFASAAISNAGSGSNPQKFETPPQGYAQKGFESVVWTAEDANDDPLEFAVYFRGENETAWKLLKDKLDTHFYSWDTTTMADGAYYLKIVASDAPGNPSGDGLSSERESERFEVDNTPPTVTQLTADAGGGTIRVRFQASDSASSVARAQYSLDAEDWALVFPAGGLSDSLIEKYDFSLTKVAPGEHTVTVRVYDEFDNLASAKVTVRLGGS